MRLLPSFPVRLLLGALAAGAALSLPSPAAGAAKADAAIARAFALLSADRPRAAREALRRIDPAAYDLGDYVTYFTGLSHAMEGDRAAAEAAHERLTRDFPASPLVPYLSLEIAFLAAKDNDFAAARAFLAPARGRVSGNGRKAKEGYVAARLLEEGGASAAAAEAHLSNFAAWPAQEGGVLSMERLWTWRGEGLFARWGLPVSFHRTFARALARCSEGDRAAAVYAGAMEAFAPSEEWYGLVLDLAEFLRKQGRTDRAGEVLSRAVAGAPPSFLREVEFSRARVDWKAGRLADARRTFLSIADNGAASATAERARYLAAWIAEEEKDVAAAAEEFGKLANATDPAIRTEALFRRGFDLYRLGRYAEALAVFSRGERQEVSSVERARHAYWKARAAAAAGDAAEARALLAALASDPGAGPYAFLARRDRGERPYALLEASGGGETASCGQERARPWERVREAPWGPADAVRVRRAQRLVELGIVEYAVIEAEGVDPGAARAAIGLADRAGPGLFRYLAGDLRGAIRETKDLPNDPAAVELVDRLQYPLAPHLVGDCEKKRSGIDPLVLHAVIRQESQFQPGALSPAGAVGLMQLLPRTAVETARKERLKPPRRRDLLRPEINVKLGAAYLARLVRDYGGDYLRAVAAYNAGKEAVARWWEAAGGDPAFFLEAMTYRETRFYVRRVFLNLLQYYLIYRPRAFARHLPTPPTAEPPAPGGEARPAAPRSPGALSAGPGAPGSAPTDPPTAAPPPGNGDRPPAPAPGPR